jgi:hypothetical protein
MTLVIPSFNVEKLDPEKIIQNKELELYNGLEIQMITWEKSAMVCSLASYQKVWQAFSSDFSMCSV